MIVEIKDTVLEEPTLKKILERLYVVKDIVILSAILFAILLGLLVGVIPFCFGAKEIGNDLGTLSGKTAGTALGSFDGITNGLEAGYQDGKEEGLKAKDTQAMVADEMTSIGRLNVLVAQDQFVNDFREGNDYKALFVYKAQTIFSVDLARAGVSVEGNTLRFIIPRPECEFIIDENESAKLAEWQKHFWSGSTESGYMGYMNSMAQIKQKSASEMSNYATLMKQAESSAKKQAGMLVNSITGGKYTVEVAFEGEEAENE